MLRDALADVESLQVRHASIANRLSRLGFAKRKSLVAAELCRAPIALHRRNAMVHPKVHEHDPADRGSSPGNRCRVKTECARNR